MTLAPWRPILARALHRNRARAYCRYLQLATINASGRPSNRTVVFRGFVGTALQIVTDGRSQKVQHIQAQPWAEACWYFTVTREQFRISGKLTVVAQENDPIRMNAWQAMSANARQQFYWPHPGQPKADITAFEPVVLSTQGPPDSFYVLLLEADRVDHLMLKGTPQDRYIYEYRSGEWGVNAVNP
ncbi:pyridoxamine 5'-phosphate oxidase family protein [Leptolyngbya cf. ectocarpi LEGE 11479]|uniref:Pyridoxamine 5'-phosphate oxidase family protein n=1 Tax=Leptolyngbya cf. ectocarpi LEGE 11479 TaxID=1828722 RepID=A0A928ZQG9_LEPEC|nr:Npun_F5749 family FMN-dependent PPOX-type flavoprotein [Leptolyngbya ectocarpi]MBE9065368.1 pyridoxamine 5'-phosphate oxidase family protein [Leptolyngbya cf. ectocarpi LEGE 11479]